MAEAATASVIQQLEDLTECSIHRGTYENPRQLPCLHSFCLQCLVNYTKDKPLANNITCPLCRREITIPADGIQGFPRSFFIDKVIEIKRLTGPAQKDTLCDLCKEDEEVQLGPVPVASMFCAECRKNLCDRCAKEHRRHNKSHSVLQMGNGDINDELVKKLEVSFCSDHSSKAVEMFCLDCQAVICMICFAEKHKLHNCFDINNSAKDFRKQMEREIETISVCISEGQKTKEMIDKKKDDFLQQIQSIEKRILERREELRRIIDRDSAMLLDELKLIKSSHLKDMQIRVEEIQRHLTIIESLKAYGKEIVTVGSASDVCRSVNQFHTRTKEVQATVDEAPFCEVVCRSVSFQSTEFQESLDRNSLGRLEANYEKLLFKDLCDSEKSLRKTLNVNPGKKDTSLQGDVFNKHSQSKVGHLAPEATMEESLPQSKRCRQLKSPAPGGDTSMEADAQRGLAKSRVDDGRVLDEEKRKLSESGDYVSIEVDRDRHHYVMTHFADELKEQLPSFHAFEAKEGKYKVAFALNSKKNGGELIRAKYMSLLGRFHFEIVRVPESVDGSALRSLVTAYDDKDSSFVLDEDNKTYKLIGKKINVDKMKKLIEDHISEQLKPSKDTEGTWKVQNSKRKGKKTASTLSFYMDHGKLNRSESSQSSATKNRSLQVSLFDKTKALATEATVCAVDSKMQGFGDVEAAVEFERDRKYKDECRSIVNEHHNSIPVGKVVHTTTTSVFQLKTKIKYIVHVVLEDKCAPAASVVGMRDVIYRCLHHAEKTLQTKSITFPHLGGSDYCDIGSFARGSVEALQLLSSTSHLQRVCFVVKDSKTLQELAAEFESCADHQQ